VLSLQHEDNVFSGKVTLRSYDYLQPSLSLESSLSGDGKEEVYDYPGNYLSLEEGERYARIRLEAEDVRRQVLRGTGNCRSFGGGLTVDLEEPERGGARTKLLLLEVRHSMAGNSVRAWESSGGADYRNSFLAIPLATPFRPRRRAHKALVHGTQTALVVVASGEEIWSDNYGRVKVQFYWDRKGKKDETSSCWVRVATPWAGKNWGAVQLPRKGQEVVVDFLEGDPDRPIIIGSVYNAEQMPPYTLSANVTQSGVKSRSSKEGGTANFNEIRMEDKKDAELLYIHAEKDKSVVVENDRTESVGANETITIGENRSESVGDNETISIGSNRSESVGKDESVSIGKKRAHSIGTSDSLDVGGNRTVNVGGNSSTKVEKNTTLTVGDSLTVSVAKDHKEETKKNYSLKAEKIFIEGTNEIEIKSGSASIILKKNGDIQIKGGKINVKGSGDVVIKGSKIGEN
jgi:type VI secretion system secreted protein VgrG